MPIRCIRLESFSLGMDLNLVCWALLFTVVMTREFGVR